MKKTIQTFNYIFITGIVYALLTIRAGAQTLPGFDTNLEKRSINLSELIDGGPGKDGIPSIDNPKFVSQEEAASWLNGVEPVISLEINCEARAYPIQILMWHEIANDELSLTVEFLSIKIIGCKRMDDFCNWNPVFRMGSRLLSAHSCKPAFKSLVAAVYYFSILENNPSR